MAATASSPELKSGPSGAKPKKERIACGPFLPSSQQYWRHHRLKYSEHIVDGFCDGGRDAVTPDLSRGDREVLVIDVRADPKLQRFLADVGASIAGLEDAQSRVTITALVIAHRLGGRVRDRAAWDAVVRSKMRTRWDVVGRRLRLGELLADGDSKGYGLCRHRALLFKLCCERLDIVPCQVVRGAVGGHGHAWNVILIRGKPLLVDTMWEPGSFFDLDSDEMPPYARLMDDATAAQALRASASSPNPGPKKRARSSKEPQTIVAGPTGLPAIPTCTRRADAPSSPSLARAIYL